MTLFQAGSFFLWWCDYMHVWAQACAYRDYWEFKCDEKHQLTLNVRFTICDSFLWPDFPYIKLKPHHFSFSFTLHNNPIFPPFYSLVKKLTDMLDNICPTFAPFHFFISPTRGYGMLIKQPQQYKQECFLRKWTTYFPAAATGSLTSSSDVWQPEWDNALG